MTLILVLNDVQKLLHAHWRRKRGERLMPFSRDVDPSDVRGALPFSVVLDVVEARLRFFYTGSSVVEAFGSDPRGQFLDDVMPVERYAVSTRSYAMAMETGRPVISRSKFVAPRGPALRITRLVLPTTMDGIHVARLVACLHMPPISAGQHPPDNPLIADESETVEMEIL